MVMQLSKVQPVPVLPRVTIPTLAHIKLFHALMEKPAWLEGLFAPDKGKGLNTRNGPWEEEVLPQ